MTPGPGVWLKRSSPSSHRRWVWREELLEPPTEPEPVTATVDHADIRGLVTTLLVSVAAPASL
jgi:hypothetical protein